MVQEERFIDRLAAATSVLGMRQETKAAELGQLLRTALLQR